MAKEVHHKCENCCNEVKGERNCHTYEIPEFE